MTTPGDTVGKRLQLGLCQRICLLKCLTDVAKKTPTGWCRAVSNSCGDWPAVVTSYGDAQSWEQTLFWLLEAGNLRPGGWQVVVVILLVAVSLRLRTWGV